MELQTIREHLVSLREDRYQRADNPSAWTQDAVAKRAGIEQSVLSKIERLERRMTEIRARVLFAIIERGLQISLSTFFAQIEGTQAGTPSALPRAEASADATVAVAPSSVDLAPFEAFGTALGRSLVAAFDRQRKAQSRARKKPRRRAHPRVDARRRA